VSASLEVHRDGAVARLSLARPPLNVLDRALDHALAEAIESLALDRGLVAIVLDGGAARGFSAGVEVADHVPGSVAGMLEDFHGVVRALLRSECVTVAAIHGFALGGGLELAMACDLVLCEEDARLGFPEITLGCYPPVAAALLPARVGWAVACELALTGEPVTASRAHALGLVNRLCAPGALRAETDRLLDALRAKSPAVLREAKRALRDGAAHGPAQALRRIEARYLGDLMRLEDATEGIRAFQEKRPPRWQNR